jgi:Flp pilus assembly protein TadG
MKKLVGNEKGAFVVIFALCLMILLGFVALGIEGGRWYLVKSELSKSVDAAALAGANNISNPYVDPTDVAEDFGRENFKSGLLGTPGSGTGVVNFAATRVDNNKISVTGNVNATPVLAQLFGVTQIPISSIGIAQKNKVEIMLILDRSGSMADPTGFGQSKMQALKGAASSFVEFFRDSQDEDKIGLVSFATTTGVWRNSRIEPDVVLNINTVDTVKTAINGMTANGATNTEEAIDISDGPGGFTDQTGVPGDQRVQQYVVFFSDGMPTALTDRFKYGGTDYVGIVYGVGSSGHANCRTSDYSYMSVYGQLHRLTGTNNFFTDVNPDTTGDGNKTSGTPLTACYTTNRWGQRTYYANTKWNLFSNYPVPGYGPETCSIPMNVLLPYFCRTAKQLALDNAQVLKGKYVKIYTIFPLGPMVDQAFMQDLSSGGAYFFPYDPSNPTNLRDTFEKIAKEIKLRLVQ